MFLLRSRSEGYSNACSTCHCSEGMAFRLAAGLHAIFVLACVGLLERYYRKRQHNSKLRTRWPENAIQRRAGRDEFGRELATRSSSLKIDYLFAQRHTVGKTWDCTTTRGSERIVAFRCPAMWTVAGNLIAGNRKVAELTVLIYAAYFPMRPQAVLDKMPLGRRLEYELTMSIAVMASTPRT